MEFNKKQSALLYLDKLGFYYYQEGLLNVVSLGFLETSVKDMDVINGASIKNQIKAFIDQYQITPASVTIILSPNVTFEKDLVGFGKEEETEQVKKFVDTIPFESVLSKVFPIANGVKVVGCNDDLYTELKMGFENNKFTVTSIVPYQLLGNDQALIQNLTIENAAQLLKRLDRLKQFSLVAEQKDKPAISTSSTQTNTITEKPKSNKPRLYAMAGIFVVLFIILGYMLLHMK